MKESPILGVALLCVVSAAAQPAPTVPKNIHMEAIFGHYNGLIAIN